MKSRTLLFGLVLLTALAYADEGPSAPSAPTPWLTGPLIAPTGTVIPYGHFTIESYLYCTTNSGTYNKDWHYVSSPHNFFILNPQFLCYFGLTSWMDIKITPQFFYNTTSNQHSGGFGDFTVGLDFQLFDAGAKTNFPGIKFAVKETFPTGKYQHLNPKKLMTDQTGAGTYATIFNLVLYKVYHLGTGHHFLSTTYYASYTINIPITVRGFNTYGGGFGTRGKVLPGNIFQATISFEYSLNQNWVIALDNVYTHTDHTEFFGALGRTSSGAQASVESPSNEQISFAPALEYNFSSHFGICAGCWFTAWGRNSTAFISGVVNFDYTY